MRIGDTIVETATISLWGHTVGAVSWLADRGYAVFEYDPAFLKRGLDIAPIHMPLEAARQGKALFSFPSLYKDTFCGLPGLLADALPDKFGNSIIDAWLARQGRDSASFSPIERLCYIGKRGMGALTFAPAMDGKYNRSVPIEVSSLVALAQQVTDKRKALNTKLGCSERANSDAMLDIVRVGTSAGGARPKALIAMNDAGHVLSGQGEAPQGYDYWILKLDGVTDLELGEPKGYGRIEYAYYLMAKAAGITMTDCRLLEENARIHFMTKRFDCVKGKRLHLQSLCGIAHYDFNQAGAYSYEQVFGIMRQLRLSQADAAQQYRRMVFNIVARNMDDHTKNIAFLMDRAGQWSLSPAFDITYAHNPAGQWTNQHQMSVNGKRDHFSKDDLLTVGHSISLPKPEASIEDVINAVERWPEFAKEAGMLDSRIKQIATYHRLFR